MNERLEALRITRREPGHIGLLLYAPWHELVIRVWPSVVVGSTDVSRAEWEWLGAASAPAIVAADRDWNARHGSQLLPTDRDLNGLLAGLPGGPFHLSRSSRDAAPLVAGDGVLIGREPHVDLCSRDADCDRSRHSWLALESADDESMLIWHINQTAFALVPPTPLHLSKAPLF